MVVLDEFRCKV